MDVTRVLERLESIKANELDMRMSDDAVVAELINDLIEKIENELM